MGFLSMLYCNDKKCVLEGNHIDFQSFTWLSARYIWILHVSFCLLHCLSAGTQGKLSIGVWKLIKIVIVIINITAI